MPTQIIENRRIMRHIANLNDPDEKVSLRAENYLIRYYGARALEQLLEACQHPSPVVRFRAVWALALTHDPRAYETILRLTDDPDEHVRYDATIALGILGDERAIEPLTRMHLNYDINQPTQYAFQELGMKSVSALTELLHHDNPDVRESVVQVLGNLAQKTGDSGCIELLQAHVNDPDSTVREGASYWLDEIRKVEPRISLKRHN